MGPTEWFAIGLKRIAYNRCSLMGIIKAIMKHIFYKTVMMAILTAFALVYSQIDDGIYSISPTKYITINKKFKELFISEIKSTKVVINIHKMFGKPGEDIKSNTIFQKHEEYIVENDGLILWKTLLFDNIDEIKKEDTGSIHFITDFCGFDTLYLVTLKNETKTIDVCFSHIDLKNSQLRIKHENELYFLKLNKKIISTLKNYLTEVMKNVNEFYNNCK
jgi:hypothetical protein